MLPEDSNQVQGSRVVRVAGMGARKGGTGIDGSQLHQACGDSVFTMSVIAGGIHLFSCFALREVEALAK